MFGWLDERKVSASGSEAEEFRALIEVARQLGTTVVVLMPEHSVARRLIPDSAASSLFAVLRADSNAIPVIDFRSSEPDSVFHDYAHLAATGRAEFSELLGGRLVRYETCATSK